MSHVLLVVHVTKKKLKKWSVYRCQMISRLNITIPHVTLLLPCRIIYRSNLYLFICTGVEPCQVLALYFAPSAYREISIPLQTFTSVVHPIAMLGFTVHKINRHINKKISHLVSDKNKLCLPCNCNEVYYLFSALHPKILFNQNSLVFICMYALDKRFRG